MTALRLERPLGRIAIYALGIVQAVAYPASIAGLAWFLLVAC